MSSLKPNPVVKDIQADYNRCKRNFEEAFKEFHQNVFSNKVLDSNKSAAVKNTETHVVDKMMNAAVALDQANAGEGLLDLCTVAIREMLTIRDRANELEYELYKALRDMKKMKQELDSKNVKEKNAT
jgi:hypothetical protein